MIHDTAYDPSRLRGLIEASLAINGMSARTDRFLRSGAAVRVQPEDGHVVVNLVHDADAAALAELRAAATGGAALEPHEDDIGEVLELARVPVGLLAVVNQG